MALTASTDRASVLEAMQEVMGPLRPRDGLTASPLTPLPIHSRVRWGGDTHGRAGRLRRQAVALDVQFGAAERLAGAVWRIKLSYAAEAGDRVSAYLCLPPPFAAAPPAMLCLHGTSGGDGGIVGVPGDYGKYGEYYGAEGDDPGMHYGLYAPAPAPASRSPPTSDPQRDMG